MTTITLDQQSIKAKGQVFYDSLSTSLLADYVYGNPRTEAAIRHALQWIPADAGYILDIGCGIGWSTWEIKRNHVGAFVLGVDLSPKAIEIAQKLFSEPGLTFAGHDITELNKHFDPPFDAIVMLDVYEHVPKDFREKLHRLLSEALGANGVVILTYPSVFHQNYLRTRQPDGLQPVDEDVTTEDVAKLARDINGSVTYYSHANIWHANDYVHLVIKRNPMFITKSQRGDKKLRRLESMNVRSNRVDFRLGVRITREGVVLPNSEGPSVCIIQPNKSAYSETFIRAHLERLPARIRMLYGGWFPTFTENGRPLLSLLQRSMQLILGRAFDLNPRHFQNASLRRYLRREKVEVVLAEYGPTGVSVMEACHAEGIPLVMQFHGFDAYDHPTLEEYRSAYQRSFAAASAVIAVSRHMEQQLLTLGAPREKLFYNPCGADTSLFSGAAPAAALPVFVAVGRFADKKAPHLTLLAFKKVLQEYPDARLIMIGNGELWEACKQLARALGVAQAVEFAGPRPHTEVAVTMRTARAFVQHSIKTSHGDSEGTPVAVLEAGAAGLPVVSTSHGGIKDVVIHGETGFLVNEGDLDGMAEYMIKLAKDATLAATLGQRAREHICANFSMEKSIDRLWQIIEGAIHGQRS